MIQTMTPLEDLHQRLAGAQRAEEVFGDLGAAPGENLRRVFQEMVRVAHPDRCAGDEHLASATFTLLLRWREEARTRIARGLYGTATAPADPKVIAGPRGSYRMHEPAVMGDYAAEYRCDSDAQRDLLFKITQSPCDNPPAMQEAQALRQLESSTGRAYFPRLVDAFQAADASGRRQALILNLGNARHTLQELRTAYPAGLDPRDAAWMFNRLLEGLYFTHQAGLVHGAILPANVRVDIARHGLVLTEWAYSVEAGTPLTAISGAHDSWYPPEVFRKEPAGPGLDIYMAARCLVYLLGGTEVAGEMRHPQRDAAALRALAKFVRGCLLPAGRRPTDAGTLREEFGALLRSLFGRPAFRPFAMPDEAASVRRQVF